MDLLQARQVWYYEQEVPQLLLLVDCDLI